MALAAPIVSVADGNQAAVNVANGASVNVTSTSMTVALQSSTGVLQWDVVLACPAYPPLDGYRYRAGQGGLFQVQVALPPTPVQITVNSEVNDGNNISTATATVFSNGANQASQNPAIDYPFRARAVVTTLQAYGGTTTGTLTETSNGAISAADGVTLAVGDTVFIQAGTTNLSAASDSGPYVVVALGGASAKWVLTRPAWWQPGAMPLGGIVELGGEGAAYGGSQWKSFAAKGSTIDGASATDPAFYVREFVSAVTLVTGFSKLGPSQTFPGLRSLTETDISFIPTSFSGAGSTVSYRTGAYASGGSATAIGYAGTSTASITALVAAGTFNTSDVSTGILTIRNY